MLHSDEIGFSWFEVKLWLEQLHEVLKVIQLFVEELCRILSYFCVSKEAEVFDSVENSVESFLVLFRRGS